MKEGFNWFKKEILFNLSAGRGRRQ